MAEYVELREILEYLDVMIDALSFPLSESGEEVKAYVEGFKEARSVVERFPTADVAPVRHGSIIETIENGRMKRVFSCCGTDFTEITCWMTPNFCPECGAKMDGGDNSATD